MSVIIKRFMGMIVSYSAQNKIEILVLLALCTILQIGKSNRLCLIKSSQFSPLINPYPLSCEEHTPVPILAFYNRYVLAFIYTTYH